MAAAELTLDLITQFERLVAGTASQRQHAWTELTGGDTFWRGCRQVAQAGNSETLLEALSSAVNLVDTVPIEGDALWLWEARCLALVRLLQAALIASLAVRGSTATTLAEWLAWAAMDAPLPEPEAQAAAESEAPQTEIQRAWQLVASQGCDRELAAIRDAAVVLLGEKAANPERVVTSSLRAPLLLTIGDAGRLGWLWAERVSGGSGELLRASSTWLDPVAPSAQAAIEEAWEAVRADVPEREVADVRWWLARLPQTGEEVGQQGRAYEIHGRSLQAAAAALFYCLSCDQPYDASVAVSAELTADGTLGGVGGLGGDAPKLNAARELARACQGATVIVAEENHPSPRTIAEWREEGVQLQVARDLDELKRLVAVPSSPPPGWAEIPPERDWPRSAPPGRSSKRPRSIFRGLGAAILLGGVAVGSAFLTTRLDHAAKLERQAALSGYARQIREAAEALDLGDLARAESLLAQTSPSLREWSASHLALRTRGATVVLPPGEPIPVAALRFSRNSRSFVSTSIEGYLRTWEGGKIGEIWSDLPPRNAPLDFQAGGLSRFGERVAFVLVPRPKLLPMAPWTIIIRDRNSGAVWREAGILSRVDALAVDSTGAAVAVATHNKTQGNHLVLFAQQSGRWQRRIQRLPVRCHALAYSPDGRTLALAGERGMVQLVRNGVASLLWKAPGQVSVVEFAPDGQTLAVGTRSGQQGAVQLLTLTGKRLRRVAEMPGTITSISYDRTGNRASVTTDHGDATVWECRSWTRATSVRTSGTTKFSELVAVMSPDGTSLALGDSRGRIEKWELERQFPQQVDFNAGPRKPDGPFSSALSRSGAMLSRNPLGEVQFRPAGSNTSARLSTTRSGPLALSPDGRIAAVVAGSYVHVGAGGDGAWRTLVTKDTVAALAFTPNSRNLAVGLESGEVLIWDVRSWEQLLRLQTNPPLLHPQLSQLQFLPDQRLVGELSRDAQVTWRATH